MAVTPPVGLSDFGGNRSMEEGVECIHLLAAVDEALLHGRDTFLLLHLLLDLGDLYAV